LKDAGGVDPIDGKLPGELTANDLVTRYTKDQSIRQAPAGYQRLFVDLNDHSEMHYNGLHWVDDAGAPVNMTDQTSVKVVDVPINNMTTKTPTTGAELNTLMQTPKGHDLFDPKATYMLAPIDKINLYTNGLKDEAEIGKINNEAKSLYVEGLRARAEIGKINQEIAAGNKDAMKATAEQLGTYIRSLQTRAAGITDPASKKVLENQIDAANKEFAGVRAKLYPNSVLATAGPEATTAAAPTTPPDSAQQLTASTVASAPKDLAPVLSTFINGGQIKNAQGVLVSMPPAAGLSQAYDNMKNYQSTAPKAGRLSTEQFKTIAELLPKHYSQLTSLQNKDRQQVVSEDRSNRLSQLRAQFPDENITDKNMDQYDDQGYYQGGMATKYGDIAH
jgi:hypothetical protein